MFEHMLHDELLLKTPSILHIPIIMCCSLPGETSRMISFMTRSKAWCYHLCFPRSGAATLRLARNDAPDRTLSHLEERKSGVDKRGDLSGVLCLFVMCSRPMRLARCAPPGRERGPQLGDEGDLGGKDMLICLLLLKTQAYLDSWADAIQSRSGNPAEALAP